MTGRNPYVDLCLAAQAMRRDADRVRTPLVPAMGVAASMYTHQLANALRILSDLRVRHLLADEVGLGKTVQALMVLNALRSERRELRALVIVPDRLVPQWRDEVLTRAHTAPIGGTQEGEGSQYIRLAWEAQLKMADEEGAPLWSLSDIDPSNYDVLVVDELHRLRADVQDRIVRVAPAFEHVLVLSATPAFQRPERHAQLFAIVEPERAALARWEQVLSNAGAEDGLAVDDNLSRWPAWATRGVVSALLERDQIAAETALDDPESLKVAALASCAYRRVIRTRRVDYGGVLPMRRHHPILVEPLGPEEERQALMWQYFRFLGEFTSRFDATLLAKRVILSPPSLEKRLDYLRRTGHDRDRLLERAKLLVHRGNGDSRLDALIDLLARIWSVDCTERVLVAAQDNPTVDYLFEMVQARLPVIGPLQRRIPLVVAAIRQGQAEEMLEDLGGYGNKTSLNLEAFQRGEAQILLAPDKAQVGLNLQRARVLVLYSVPWRPEEVEQWIGRLDRIGNAAAFTSDGEARAVDVYTITQRGLVDQKVVAVLTRFNVFERSVNLDGDHLEEIARSIEAAALRPETVNWRQLESTAEAMAAEDEVQELKSALRPWLPWTVAAAKSVRKQVDAIMPSAPVLNELGEHTGGLRSLDRALEGMVKLLQRSEEYHVRWNTDPTGGRFRTLWYRFGDRSFYGQREVGSRVIFSFGADPMEERSPRYAHAFITRRGDIESPPLRSVTMTVGGDEVRRPLHFLGFGNPLHDELVSGWMPQGDSSHALDVALFEDHALMVRAGPGLYVLRMAVLDPAAVLTRGRREDLALERMAFSAASTAQPEHLLELLAPHTRQLKCALEADARWLRAQLPAELVVDGRRYASGQWTAIEAQEICSLLNPMAHGRKGLPASSPWQPSLPEASAMTAVLKRMREDDRLIAKRTWSHRLPAFERSLAARRELVLAERIDAESLASLRLQEAERRLDQANERGNRTQQSRAENTRIARADEVAVVRALWSARQEWLEDCGAAIRDLLPSDRLTAFIRVRCAR